MAVPENKQLIVIQNTKSSQSFIRLQNEKRENGTGSSQHNGIGVRDYRWEEERLKSFNTWPRTDIDIDKLAAAGFYYLHRGDKVQCAFCGIEISDWRPDDVPMIDHAKWSKHCPFVNNISVGNVPRHVSSSDSSADTGVDECGPYKIAMPVKVDLIADPNIHENPNFVKMRPPSFPEFISFNARMMTFESWPISLKLKPKILSEAGFYYTGKGDQTICFHCGGGLKDWEETDEPWVEHARWFSKCPYVISVKGKGFIEEVCGKKAVTELKSAQLLNGSGLSSSTGELEKVQTYQSSEEATSLPESSQSKTEGNEMTFASSSSCGSPGSSDVMLCKICYTDERAAVFLPCGHMIACIKCAISVSTCPVCRQRITAMFRTYVS